jgi:hypothetical protein
LLRTASGLPILQEIRHYFQQLSTTAFGPIQVDKMGRILEHYHAYARRMHQMLLQELPVLGSGPEIPFGCEHQSRRGNQGRVPKLPPGCEIKAVLQRSAW